MTNYDLQMIHSLSSLAMLVRNDQHCLSNAPELVCKPRTHDFQSKALAIALARLILNHLKNTNSRRYSAPIPGRIFEATDLQKHEVSNYQVKLSLSPGGGKIKSHLSGFYFLIFCHPRRLATNSQMIRHLRSPLNQWHRINIGCHGFSIKAIGINNR